MQLLDHVSIGVPDLDIARRFYDAIMNALGAAKVYDLPHALGYGARCTPQDAASTYVAVYLDQGPIGTTSGTGVSRPRPVRRSTRFTRPALRLAGVRTAPQGYERTTIQVITQRFSMIRRATALKRSVTSSPDDRSA